MSIYLVTYDLNNPGQNYPSVTDAIKKYDYFHLMQSVWLVHTSETAAQVGDKIWKSMDGNDKIYVVELTANRFGRFSTEAVNWIKLRFK